VNDQVSFFVLIRGIHYYVYALRVLVMTNLILFILNLMDTEALDLI